LTSTASAIFLQFWSLVHAGNPSPLSKREAEAIPKAEPCLGRYRTKPPGNLSKCLIRRHHSKWQRIKHGIDLPLRHAGMDEMGHHLGVIHAAYADARDPSGDLGGPCSPLIMAMRADASSTAVIRRCLRDAG